MIIILYNNNKIYTFSNVKYFNFFIIFNFSCGLSITEYAFFFKDFAVSSFNYIFSINIYGISSRSFYIAETLSSSNFYYYSFFYNLAYYS